MMPNTSGISQPPQGMPGPGTSVPGMNQVQPPPGPIQPAPVPQQAPEQPQEKPDFRQALEAKNFAERMKEDKLRKIGQECKQGFETDKASRKEWEDHMETWIKLTNQTVEKKSWPWQNASNIKFPLMGIAAMQFSARAYPSLVPANGQIVSAKIYGKDPDGMKTARAQRVSRYLSYQIMEEMDDWEGEMDRLLMQQAILGIMFKKTYYDPNTEKLCSYIISPENFIVNYWTRDLHSAERISELFHVYEREMNNRMRSGFYREVELSSPVGPDKKEPAPEESDRKVVPYEVIEQHTYSDLDDDGYDEPVIVTFERTSGEVLRIISRADLEDIKMEDDEIIHIGALQYYTAFPFIPNPNGCFYAMGFGHLLGPLNASVDTIVNQLVDAGTLANLQVGFLGKGLRVKGGNYDFSPGEWKQVNATGDDLRKQIVPLPTKEPSAVLFQLLQYLVGAGKELASIAEIFVGKMPGQNTPATTTSNSIEQGMKVFTAIYKRVYRALNQEFALLYKLNRTYLDPQTYVKVLDEPIGPGDFDTDDYDICPSADPSASTTNEKMAKAQALLQIMPLGTLDPIEVTKRVLEAQEQPNWEKLIPGLAQTGQASPPPPDPKVMEMQLKSKAEQEKAALKKQETEHKLAMDQRSNEQELMFKAQEARLDLQRKSEENRLQAEADYHKQQVFVQQTQMANAQKQQDHAQKLQQNEQGHAQKMRHTEESQKLAQKSQGTTGKAGKTRRSPKRS